MSDVEINFCTDDDVITVMAIAVPRGGEVISIRGADFTVVSVFWAIDYSAKPLRERRLRATVKLQSTLPGGGE